MKSRLIIFALLLSVTWANAQNEKVETYFHNKGVALLANCAHPTGTIEGGTYSVDDQSVIVDIVYTGGTRTKLRLDRMGSGFSKVTVLYDNGIVPAFAFIKVVSDAILSQYKDSDAKNEIIRELENSLDKQLSDWSGADWALLLVDLDYFSNN
jgi:hypothetical protein